MVQLRRTGGSRPVELRTKLEGPDETHEAPQHISQRTNVEPTAGESVRFRGEPPVSAQRFIYLVAGAVVKTIELETGAEAKARTQTVPPSNWPSCLARPCKLLRNTTGRDTWKDRTGQDQWPSDEEAILRASEWLHRNVQVTKPDRTGIQMEAESSAISPLATYRRAQRVRHQQQPRESVRTDAEVGGDLRGLRLPPGRSTSPATWTRWTRSPAGQGTRAELVHSLRGGQAAEEILARLHSGGPDQGRAGVEHRHRDKGVGEGNTTRSSAGGPRSTGSRL